jgi:hypothetical protein
MALLPDPVDVKCLRVAPAKTFDIEDWKGKYGVLYITGESSAGVRVFGGSPRVMWETVG